jgi:hypothetical protein
LGWWGLVNGYSGFTPARQVDLGQQLADLASAEAMATLRQLGSQGVRYLIVHPDEAPLQREKWEEGERWHIEKQTTLLPAGPVGPDELYYINSLGDRLITEQTTSESNLPADVVPVQLKTGFRSEAGSSEIELLAYSLQAPALGQSNRGRLTLYWQTSAPLETDYTVFVHALGGDGHMIGQSDGPPVANHHPTSAWQPGEIVQDSRLVPVANHYLVGLYLPETGTRLMALGPDGSRWPNDAVTISP